MIRFLEIQRLRGRVTVLFLATGLLSWVSVTAHASPTKEIAKPGIVVEEVVEGSTLHQAGLKAGDILISWRRMPSPPANPKESKGRFVSPFDWKWVVEEQSPRGTIKIKARRNGRLMTFNVSPGLWHMKIRPSMPTPTLEIYLQARKLIYSGDLEKAAILWKTLTDTSLDKNWHSKCWFMLQAGDMWSMTRNWKQAHRAYGEALHYARDPLSQIVVRTTIGITHKKQRDFKKSKEAYHSAQKICKVTWQDNLILARILEQLGETSWEEGQLDIAKEYWTKTFNIRKHNAPHSLVFSISLHNLGIVALERGELDFAAESLKQGLELLQTLAPESLITATHLISSGTVEIRRSQLDRAAEFHEHALKIRQEKAPNSLLTAETYTSLSELLMNRGEINQAIEYQRQALKLQRELAPDTLPVAAGYNNLGNAALASGQLNLAYRYHHQALEMQQRLAPSSLHEAKSLGYLGNIELTRGNLSLASDYHKKALEIQQQLAPSSSSTARTLHSLASISRERKLLQLALDYYLMALQALEGQIRNLGSSRDTQARFRSTFGRYYRDTIELMLDLGRTTEAFYTLERSRAQILLAQLAERDLVFSDVPEELDRARRRIAVLYDRTQQQIANLNPTANREEIRNLLSKLRLLQSERGEVADRIHEASTKLASLQYPEPLTLASAQQILDPGTVMLSYSVGEQRTDLFVIRSERSLEVHPLPIGEEELKAAVAEFLLLTHGSHWTFRTASRAEKAKLLYQTLIGPVEIAVQQSARVLIIPDGPLHILPFSSLIREGPPQGVDNEFAPNRNWHYFVEWKPVHSVLSATVYSELKKSRRLTSEVDEPPRTEFAALGDPLYPRQARLSRHKDIYVHSAAERGHRFRPLPYTRREVEGISELYPPETRQLYLGAEATEERVKSLGRSTRILHFAAHGLADDQMPLNSYVALTIPEELTEGRDNGLLQAWEIFERVRLDADLVVLSACESSRGTELPGEGLYGLTRAFQYAGARTVAGTLWSVADQATSELMIRFYRHLRSGKTKDEALQTAQIEFIRSPVQVQGDNGELVEIDVSEPYYWAAFQLTGDWQ